MYVYKIIMKAKDVTLDQAIEILNQLEHHGLRITATKEPSNLSVIKPRADSKFTRQPVLDFADLIQRNEPHESRGYSGRVLPNELARRRI